MFNHKSVEVNLDRKRKLIFNINTLCILEDVTGENYSDFIQRLQKLSAKDLRALLYACLKQDDENLTLEKVGELINSDNIIEVQKALLEVMTINMPDDERKRGGDNSPPFLQQENNLNNSQNL